MTLVRELVSKLSAQIAQQSLGDWLTESEHRELAVWRDKRRRQQWLAGRWLAKRELAQIARVTPIEIDIASRDSFGRSVAPRVCIGGRTWTGALSISHAGDHSVIAIDSRAGHRIGVDIVLDQDSSTDRATATWFSEEERLWTLADNNGRRRVAQLWATKEASYKALHRGEPFVPGDWAVLKWLHPTKNSQLEFIELDDAVIAVISTVANIERQIA